jgi:hypothetical protein
MPIVILLIGIVLIAAGINNKVPELMKLLKEDFKPSDNSTGFHIWLIVIVALGSLGYVRTLKGAANGMLLLILLVIVLADYKRDGTGGGFFIKFTNAIKGI